MAHHALSPDTFERVIHFVQQERLDRTDPSLVILARSINPANPSMIDHQLWTTLLERLGTIKQELHRVPFLRQHLPQEGYIVAYQWHDHQPIRNTKAGYSRHTQISSASGGGKTTLLHHMLRPLLADGVKVIDIDAKDDSRYLAVEHRMLVLNKHTRWNPLAIPAFSDRATHQALVVEKFAATFWGGENIKAVVNDGLNLAYAEHETPSLQDLYDCVERLYSKTETYSRRDSIRGGGRRLQQFKDRYPGMFACRVGIPTTTLLEHSVYLPVTLQTEADDFVTALIPELLFLRQMAVQRREDLKHMIVLDESQGLWNQTQRNIAGVPPLAALHSKIREYAIGMVVTTTSLRLTHQILRSNTYLQIALPQANHQETEEVSKTLGLNKAQTDYLDRHLSVGHCILRTGDLREPILATFPPLQESKAVTEHDWHDLQEETNRLAPPQLPPAITTTTEVPEQTPYAVKLPTEVQPLTHPVPVRLAITETDERLLRDVAAHPLTGTMESYERIGVANQVGHRAKFRLMTLSLLESHRIQTSAGRGGTTVVLRVTKEGYKWLGEKEPTWRPGSIQHQWLLQHIAIKGGVREAQVSKKRVDFGVSCTKDNHQLLSTILESATPVNEYEPLEQGQFVAIECEASAADRTALNNARKNHASGIPLTIIAVLPKAHLPTLAELRTELSPEEQQHTVLIDVFTLIDLARCKP